MPSQKRGNEVYENDNMGLPSMFQTEMPTLRAFFYILYELNLQST